MIARVFRGIADGRYIDVGSFKPEEESNTYALYQRGWSGVAADPIYRFEVEWGRRWQAIRPRDIILHDAVGAEQGEVEYFICNYRGLSTASKAVIDRNLALHPTNAKSDGSKVGVTTLNDIIAKLMQGVAPHLICIDVEGMEGDVLQGIDLIKYRPWLFVIEGYYSADMTPHWPAWQSILIDRGYGCVWDDRVNRWYLADERGGSVNGAFAFPPNVTDNYLPYTELKLQRRLEDLEMTRATLLTLRG